MTNKKFKIAAMSMALTACVAAQPLLANAAENADTAPSTEPTPTQADDAVSAQAETNTPSDPADGSTAGQAAEPDGSNKESTEEKEEAFGEDVDVKYDREHPTAEDPKTGATTLEGEVVKKDDSTGETGETGAETPAADNDPGSETEPGSGDEDQKSDFGGNATKTETPDPDSTVTEDPVPKPGAKPETKTDTKVDPDGTTTITDTTTIEGTQTTTTTGSGHAEADTKETTKDTDTVSKDDLDAELGADTKIDWDIKEGDPVGDTKYNVIGKSEETTGNKTKQTLTLEKVDQTTGRMTAEDIAKLVDADPDAVDKKEDGSYTLKRTETVTDASGSPVTRTTYITVRAGTDEVTITTTTTIRVTREKEEHKVDDKETISNGFTLPEITLDNETKETISSDKLKDLLAKAGAPDSTTKGEYVVREGNREYTITVNKEAAGKLSPEEIVEKLGKDYTYDKASGKFYYVGDGQHAELTVDQEEVIRERLSYTVRVRETNKDTETTVVGKDEAEAKAKDEAVRNALKNAVDEMVSSGALTEKEAEALKTKIDSATVNADEGGIFETTITADGGVKKSFKLDYSKGTITTPDSKDNPDKDKPLDAEGDDKTTENKDLTANGSSYVTSGTVSWTDSGSGEGEHSESFGQQWEKPEGAETISTSTDGKKTTTIYEVVSADGKTTTRYTVTEEEVELTEAEKEAIAWDHLKETLHLDQDLTPEQLEDMGYSISGITFNGGTKKVSWTATQTVTGTTTEVDETFGGTIYVDGGKKWTIDEKAGTITVNGTPYQITKKNDDGSYTCDVVDENNQKTSYTFTEKDSTSSLTGDQIQKMLADQLADDFPGITASDIILSDDGKTASYTKGSKTITIDYSKLGKELEVKKEEHHSSSNTVTIAKDEHYQENFEKACKDLLDQIKREILPEVEKAGKELWLGSTQVTKDTTLTKDLIEYLTKAVSSADMSHDELIKALEEQARIARETDVTVNEGKTDAWGNSFEETLKNYYSGEEQGDYYQKEDGSLVRVRKRNDGNYYYKDGKKWTKVDADDVIHYAHDDDIGHLDLASGSKLELLPDEKNESKTTDCVLIRNGLTLEWNYDANDLVKGVGNTTVGLDSKISYDPETGNTTGHYEYDRGTPNNKPNKSAFYKLTGTVAYDAVTEKDENGNDRVKIFEDSEKGKQDAVDAYLNAVGRTGESYETLSQTKEGRAELDNILKTYIVQLGHTNANRTGPTGYQVYTKTSQLEAYGYMTRDANTCVNQTYERQYDSFDYLGGFDLMISKLVQVREGKVVGQTESSIKTITAPWSIRSSETKTDDWLQLTKKTTETTTTTENPNFGSGSGGTTDYDFGYNYTQDHTYELGGSVAGEGHGRYNSFVKWIDSIFSGKSGDLQRDDGSFSYKYNYSTVSGLQGEHLTQTVEKHAQVDYDYAVKDVRDVDIVIDEKVTIITPDGGGDDGGTIIEESTPETPILPGNAELPPVQDARPDAPVLPSAPVLPPVQDAHIASALPQTGVNWLTAIGLALSGMTLMVTGAFASLTGKGKKEQP